MKKLYCLLIMAVLMSVNAYSGIINVPADEATLQDAVTAAVAGDEIIIASGTHAIPAQININKANLTITGAGATQTKLQVSGTGYRFYITASGVTIQDLEIEKTDKTSQNIIYIGGNDASFLNMALHGQFVIGDGEVSRGFEMAAVSGLLIDNCDIFSLRQPAYVNAASGTISNCLTYITKGWVIVSESNLTFTNNSWGTGANSNYYDIAIIKNTPLGANNYADFVDISKNNNDAVIENQYYTPALLSVAHVDVNTAATGFNGSYFDPYTNIAAAYNRIAEGGKIKVAKGTYVLSSTLNIHKPLSFEGESMNNVIIDASNLGNSYGISVQADDVSLKNFTLRPPVVPANRGTSSGGGYAIHASFNHSTTPYEPYSNLNLELITISGSNRTAFDIHGYDGVTLTSLNAYSADYGNGISLTGCTDVHMQYIESLGNAWGSIAVYCSKAAYLNRPSSDITFDFSQQNGMENIYIEDEFGLTNTNINVSGWSYAVQNQYADPASNGNFLTYFRGNHLDAVGIGSALNSKFSNMKSVAYRSDYIRYYVGDGMSIQAALDAATSNDIVNVLPGNYHEKAVDRTTFGAALYQFGLYFEKDGVTLQGINPNGSPVTDYNNAAALVTTNATNNFGVSGLFVKANNVKIYGMKIGDNYDNANNVNNNKTIEVVGENVDIQYCWIQTVANQGAIYFGQFDDAHPIYQYNVSNNKLENTLVSINNGVGTSGLRADRKIMNNLFVGSRDYYLISMRGWNGANPAQGWIVRPVGGAVITGNIFNNTSLDNYVMSRGNAGGVIDSEMDWQEIWTANTYNNKVITLENHLTWDVRNFDYYGYDNSKTISPIIQNHIDMAQNGDLVLVGSGEYIQANAQLLVNKDIQLVGEDKVNTIIKPSQNTGASGDARGLILVPTGFNPSFKNFTIDGDGFNIKQALRHRGNGLVEDLIVKNIIYPPYHGHAIVAFGNLIVQDCELSNIGRVGIVYFGSACNNGMAHRNTYLGKGDGDWLDYGIEVSGGAVAEISNNTISNCTGVASTDGSTSACILATTYFGIGTTALITNNYLKDSYTAVYVGYNDSDVTFALINKNSITGNDYGVISTAPDVDATCNWWGSADICANPVSVWGPVTFLPFLNNGTDNAPSSPGFQPIPGTCTGTANVTVTNLNTAKWFCSIQSAIDDATTLNGHTIQVGDGTYNETVDVHKELTIQAGSIPLVNGGFALNTNNITIKGMTILNGGQLASPAELGGIYIKGGTSGHLIQDNNIQGNNTPGFRGIFTGFNVENTVIDNNNIAEWNSGIYLNPTSNGGINIINNNISLCVAGIGTDGQNNLTVEHNILENNSEGFGASAVGINVRVNHNKILGNTVYGGVNWYSGNAIDAEFNWWGTPDGPSGAGPGTGDAVSPNVSYCPWYQGHEFLSISTCPLDYIAPKQEDGFNLVLWLNGEDTDADLNTDPFVHTPDSFFDVWWDGTLIPENGSSATNRKPTRTKNALNGRQAVVFYANNSDEGFAGSDMMTAPYHSEITTNVNDKYNPDATTKSYMVVFKTSNEVGDGTPQPYYANSRQCIFEVGGPSSGLNTYIANGKVCVGAWNRIEKKYTILDPGEGFFNANPNSLYYVRYTYDASNKEFEATIGVFDPDGFNPTVISKSGKIKFMGLVVDPNNPEDKSGIGGAARTRYHDYNIGADYSDFFNGTIGEVLMYNENVPQDHEILSYIDAKYGTDFLSTPITKSNAWEIIETLEQDNDNAQISKAFPNPFEHRTSFNINLSESQRLVVDLYDEAGRKVQELINKEVPAGSLEIEIDGSDLENGAYFYHINAENFNSIGKVILMK